MAQETGWFRGEGGSVWQMDLPLSEDLRTQLTKGYLTRVNEDGSTYADAVPAAEEVAAPAPTVVPMPNLSAPKAAWVGYAVRVGGLTPDDAEAMTRTDLIDKFGGS